MYINNLITSIYGEYIKLKGLRLNLTAIITGIIAPVIIIITERGINNSFAHNAFINFTEHSMEFYISYFLPLYIIYSSMILTLIDHRKRGWQLMSTLPVDKYAIYTAKLFQIIKTVLYSIISHMTIVILCVYILNATGKLPVSASLNLPVAFFINIILRILVSSLFLISFQFFISVFISKYLFPIFIGFIGFAIHLILMENNIIISWYPFGPIAATYDYMYGSNIGNYMIYTEWTSFTCAIIITIIGCTIFRYQNLTLFLKQSKVKLVSTIIATFILLIITYNLITPNISTKHNRTVICGEINRDFEVKNVYLIDEIVNDTVTVIPVNNNTFHTRISTPLKYGKYQISFGNIYNQDIILGDNDSLYLKANTEKQQIEATGTSMLETYYINNESLFSDRYSILSYYLENSHIYNNPTRFFKLLQEERTSGNNRIETYRSPDNYKLSDRFKKLLKAELNIKMYNHLNTYKKGWRSLHGNKILEMPHSIDIKTEPEYNEMLLDSKTYLQIVTDHLKSNENSTDDDIIEQASRIEDSSFRDKFLYLYISNTINLLTSGKEIDTLISNHIDKVSNTKYQNRIRNQAITLKSILQGQKAPDFDAVTINNRKVSLADLKGKYLLIDVWATWCRPCKKQSRFFNRMATKLKDMPVQFVALNINRHKKDWELKTGSESIHVKHLYSTNKDKFCKDYNCKRIPRFILIDPDGYIVNSNMPKPSSKSFEEILTNYIKTNLDI
ncbi:MAG: redoxin family protein [Bacteroidales bacterium]|jgi:peroxiredoxin|nr:redoxin family protein [Bacteroidales bacterium]